MAQSATASHMTQSTGNSAADTANLETRSSTHHRTLTDFLHSKYIPAHSSGTSGDMMSRGRPAPSGIPKRNLHLARAILDDLTAPRCCSGTEGTVTGLKSRLKNIRTACRTASASRVEEGMTEEEMVAETGRLIGAIQDANRGPSGCDCGGPAATTLLGVSAALALSLAAGLTYWRWRQHAGMTIVDTF